MLSPACLCPHCVSLRQYPIVLYPLCCLTNVVLSVCGIVGWMATIVCHSQTFHSYYLSEMVMRYACGGRGLAHLQDNNNNNINAFQLMMS